MRYLILSALVLVICLGAAALAFDELGKNIAVAISEHFFGAR